MRPLLLAVSAAALVLAACDKPEQVPSPAPSAPPSPVAAPPSPVAAPPVADPERPDTSRPNVRGDLGAPDKGQAIVEAAGAVRYVDLEGGGWVIDTLDGTFQPIGLPEAFRQDGLKVRVRLRPRPDMASTLQVGRLADVVSIERN